MQRFMRFSSSGNDMPLLYDAQVQLAMAIMLPLLILILGKSRFSFQFLPEYQGSDACACV